MRYLGCKNLAISALTIAFSASMHGLPLPAADVDPVWRQPGLQDVRLEGGEIDRRVAVTIEGNILKLNTEDDFLRPFRQRNASGGYVGLGKLIDSVVRFAAHTQDPRLIELKRKLIAEATATQEPDGYIGIMKPEARMWGLWDVHEMSYIVYGLTSDHQFFGEESSLDAAERLADYIMNRWQAAPERKPGGGDITVYMAVTGLENAFLALSRQTGDDKYRDFVVRFRKLPEWDARIVVGRHGPIEGHIYAYLCRSIAQLRLSDSLPDERLWGPSQAALDFLLHREGMVITGECGDHECWHDTQTGTINLGETCATAYLIRFLDEVLRRTGDASYGDLMERAIYNALFAAQSPEGRRIRYYTPFDGPRSYHSGDTYCCPCNYRRIVAELPGMISYAAPDGIAINLYTPSVITHRLPDGTAVTVKQETEYPHKGEVRLTITPEQPRELTLKLRIPRFCETAVISARWLEKPLEKSGGGWAEIRRVWQPGDTLDLTLPLSLRYVKGRRSQVGSAAVMYGPLVFCLNRAAHPELKDVDLRLLTLQPESLEGPFSSDAVHPGGLACRVKAWGPGDWYPHAAPRFTLTLTEFPDPQGEAVYFHVPDPYDPRLADDELIVPAD
ncbi:beta-L-arabinofuranosidase domain-containing protein [Thermopirellula anaerolimosa]